MSAVAPAPPRALREPSGRWIGGVCSGLAAHLGWPVLLIRMLFLVLVLADGLGVVLYLALWGVMPLRRDAPGGRRVDGVRLAAFAAVVIGLAALGFAVGWGAVRDWIAPAVVLGLGLAILWQQRGGTAAGRPDWVRPALGALLVAAGVAALVVGEIGWLPGLRAGAVVLLMVGGAALLALPWLVGVYTDLTAERRARIREQERAEIAAHVHDSVLQTLTLIQAHAADADQVTRLARSEERRLRSWLYAPVADRRESLAAGIAHAAAGVESEHGADVDVVQVGDAAWSPRVDALVAASAEAMVNAAKHAGPHAAVSVFSEAADGSASVFVRDRGPGFDRAAVAPDRRGISESIEGRMRRAGGDVEIRTGGSGTEVRLSVDLEPR